MASCFAGLTVWVAPKWRAQLELGVDDVDPDDRVCARYRGALDGIESDTPATQNGNALTGSDRCCVHHCPESCSHGTSDQSGEVEREVPGDPYRRCFGHDYPGAVCRRTVVVDIRAIAVEAGSAVAYRADGGRVET